MPRGGGAVGGLVVMRRALHPWRYLAIVLLLLGGAPVVAAAPGERCFAETGFCVAGRFLAYWDANSGLARNGYPLTPERRETLEDGREYTVQYFERVRLEYHPENAAPYNVLLGQFGRQVFRESFDCSADRYASALQPVAPRPGMTYFAATGHNVAPDFAASWRANGGLAQLGYPLAEEQDRLEIGASPLRVQYFERGRLEAHPENAPPYDILLGQFGRTVLGWRDVPLAAPFAALYNGDPALREALGTPYAGVGAGTLAVLPFEHGLTIDSLEHDPGNPYYSAQILCGGTPDAGFIAVDPHTGLPGATGVADPAEFPVGGPGPRPGTYVPGGYVGKLWGNGGLFHDCLGYATAPAPVATAAIIQVFSRGVLFAFPERGAVYAIFVRAGGDSPTSGYFRRYPLPR